MGSGDKTIKMSVQQLRGFCLNIDNWTFDESGRFIPNVEDRLKFAMWPKRWVLMALLLANEAQYAIIELQAAKRLYAKMHNEYVEENDEQEIMRQIRNAERKFAEHSANVTSLEQIIAEAKQ